MFSTDTNTTSTEPTAFKGYMISSPLMSYDIGVSIKIPDPVDPFAFKVQTLKVNEASKNAANSVAKLSVVGDFATLQAPPILDGKMFFLSKQDAWANQKTY